MLRHLALRHRRLTLDTQCRHGHMTIPKGDASDHPFLFLPTSSSLSVESADVIRVIQQFLRDNNLHASLDALQRESGVTLNQHR